MFNDLNHKELIYCILLGIFLLVIAFAAVLKSDFGVIFLITLGFLYFLTKSIGQEIIIILTLIFSTNVLEFFNIDYLPYVQLGVGLRFNGVDLLLVPVSIRSYLILKQKNIYPKSEKFILFLLIIYFTYVILGFIFTGSPKEAGFNFLRVLFYISFYFALFNYFLDVKNIKRFFIIISTLVFIATIIQFYEYYLGYRLTIPGYTPLNENYSESGSKIISAGGERLYVWSRLPGLLYVTFVFSLSFYLTKNNKFYISFIISFISILSIFLATIRVWIATILFSIFLLISLNKHKSKIFINSAIFILLIIFSIYSISEYTYKPGQVDLISSIIGRTVSIIRPQSQYGEQNTFIVRVIVNNINLVKFSQSPIWGHGFGKYIIENFYNNDVGITNRLVQFGLLGTLPILIYIVSYIFNIIKLIKLNKISNNFQKAILIGVLTILIGHIPAYIWQLDFWGPQLVFVMSITFALGDVMLLKLKKSQVSNQN